MDAITTHSHAILALIDADITAGRVPHRVRSLREVDNYIDTARYFTTAGITNPLTIETTSRRVTDLLTRRTSTEPTTTVGRFLHRALIRYRVTDLHIGHIEDSLKGTAIVGLRALARECGMRTTGTKDTLILALRGPLDAMFQSGNHHNR